MMREAAYMVNDKLHPLYINFNYVIIYAGLCTDYMTKYLPTPLTPTSSGHRPSEIKQLEQTLINYAGI